MRSCGSKNKTIEKRDNEGMEKELQYVNSKKQKVKKDSG